MLAFRHMFIGQLKIELSLGHTGRIWAVENSPRNRKRLNKALASRDVTVHICDDGSTLITVRKELKQKTQTCEECGCCLPESEWQEGEPCPVCFPYYETGYEA